MPFGPQGKGSVTELIIFQAYGKLDVTFERTVFLSDGKN